MGVRFDVAYAQSGRCRRDAKEAVAHPRKLVRIGSEIEMFHNRSLQIEMRIAQDIAGGNTSPPAPDSTALMIAARARRHEDYSSALEPQAPRRSCRGGLVVLRC